MLTLEEWRRAKGISQQAIADVCGVHVNTYRGWENDPAKINLGDAMKISRFLGVPFSEINFLPENSTKNVDTTVEV